MINLTPIFEGGDELGAQIYPTRRIRAMQAAPHVVYMWRVARVDWFEPDDSGTTWDSIDHEVLTRGRS